METDDKKECQDIVRRMEVLQTNRRSTETTWQDCMTYIIPRKGDITATRTPGSEVGSELFDSTAILSNQLLSGALHSMLTNQSSKFFELTMADDALNDDEEVQAWLQKNCDTMHAIFNGSNFQTEVHELYQDEGAIGTACMFIGEDDDRVVHFMCRSMKEIYVSENNLGLIDTVFRKFNWTLKQIVQEFGEECLTQELLRLYKAGNSDPRVVIHVVEPEEDKSKIFKYCSRYILAEDSHKLSHKGFHEFPYVVPRWTKTSGEIYGRGPGMDALSDIKMIQAMMETTLKGAQMTVGPPMMVSNNDVIGRVRMTPFGITVVKRTDGNPIVPLITNARVDFGIQMVEDVRKRIRSHFFVDQLQLNEGPQMTATEVNQRTEEKLRLMGPVLGRQQFEFLRPLVERVFGIMQRKNLITKPPEKIKGKKFDVRYSSLIARAQRMSDGTNFTRALSVVAPIINALPQTLDNINGDRSFKYIMSTFGIPEKCMSTDQEVKDSREAKAKAQQQAAQEAQQQHQADLVQKAGPSLVQAQQAQKGQQ